MSIAKERLIELALLIARQEGLMRAISPYEVENYTNKIFAAVEKELEVLGTVWDTQVVALPLIKDN